MKEKLLKLIDACINNAQMNKEISISERIELRLSEIAKVEYNGMDVTCNWNYKPNFGNNKDVTEYGYHINIRFDKDPPIVICPILKGNEYDIKRTIVQVDGIRSGYFMNHKAKYDLTILKREFQYELRCGSYAYIIDDLKVRCIYDLIKTKREEFTQKRELLEINKRFFEFGIKD